jgi:hypothetical protein
MRVEALARRGFRVCSDERNQSLFPTLGEAGRAQRDPLAVVAERLVEGGLEAYGPVNQVSLLGQLMRVPPAEDEPAHDHDNVTVVDDGGSGSQHVSTPVPSHRGRRQAFSTVDRSSSARRPANGLFCRSSLPFGPSEVSELSKPSTGPSRRRSHSSSQRLAWPRAVALIRTRFERACSTAASGSRTTAAAVAYVSQRGDFAWALRDSNPRPQPCEGSSGHFSDLRRFSEMAFDLHFSC